MKDLFSGSLGRLNNHGGSRMFTTPNTISVPPEYEIETDVPSVAEFVTCSLDGRLWIWRRSRRYYVAVFRWDEETEKLVFVNTTILNGETVIKRGVDWILTDKSLILSSDDEPYISRTEYESSDTTYADTINKSYSFFPELETWQEIQSGQVIRVADAPNQALQVISQSLLTPLEFHYYSDDDIQAVTEFNPQLCYCNGQLYGKGKAHIGRVYLLPRTFKENGDVENFYLYVSPDYLRNYDKAKKTFNDNDGWNNLMLAPLNQNSVCSFTPTNEDYGLCKKAENGQVLSFPQIEQLDYSASNGAIFFDGLTGSNLMLNDNGASLLRDSLSYECKGLSQWIAPSGKVDAVSPQYAISSFDTGTLVTYPQQGLHRGLLTQKTIPLTAKDYAEKRLSLGEADKNSKKFIHVNSVKGDNDIALVDWENIYRLANRIKYIGTIKAEFFFVTFHSVHKKLNNPFVFFVSDTSYFSTAYEDRYPYIDIFDRKNHVYYCSGYPSYIDYISPITMRVERIEVYWDLSPYAHKIEPNEAPIFAKVIKSADLFVNNNDHRVYMELEVWEGMISATVTVIEDNGDKYVHQGDTFPTEDYVISYDLIQGPELPDELFNWTGKDGLSLTYITTDDYYQLVFTTPFKNYPLFSKNKINKREVSDIGIENYYKINNSNDETWTQGVHVFEYKNGSYQYFLYYFSEYHPEIFDFEQEIERSKFS